MDLPLITERSGKAKGRATNSDTCQPFFHLQVDVHVPLVADVPKQTLLKGPIQPRGTIVVVESTSVI